MGLAQHYHNTSDFTKLAIHTLANTKAFVTKASRANDDHCVQLLSENSTGEFVSAATDMQQHTALVAFFSTFFPT